MKKINSFEDACKALKLTPALPEVSALPEKHQKAVTALYKLIIIAEALNEGWQPDWNNWDERKYYPWFDLESTDGSGSGFSYHDYDAAYTATTVGARLCFKSSELATHAGQKFIDLYKDYMVLNQ